MSERARLFDLKERRFYQIDKSPVKIGRAPDNDIVISDSTVSRYHAEIFKKGSEWFVKDLESTNGTFVNGDQIEEIRLNNRDSITFGKREFTFFLQEEAVSLQETTLIEKIDDIFNSRPTLNLNRIINAVAQLAKLIVEGKSSEKVFEAVSRIALENTGAERSFVLLKEGKDLKISAKWGAKEEELSNTIVKKAIEEKVGILTYDALADSRFSSEDSVLKLGIRSAICVPIWEKDRILGALYIDSSREKALYQREDLEFLTMLGNYVAIAIEHRNFKEQLDAERKMRERLERYHSPAVVNKILSEKLESTAIPRKFYQAEGTVLFADIVGFASLVEELPPKEVGQLLNDFLSYMTEIVFQYEGTLDKYLGDGLMALFGIPFFQKDHAERALKAAISMQEETELKFKGKIKIRIGISSGAMIAGDFGSEKRLEFTVIGHTVNLAARFQREVAPPGGTVVSETTYQLTRDYFAFEDLGEKKLKGLKHKVKCYLLKGVK